METILQDQMNIQTRDQDFMVAAVVHSSDRRVLDTVEVTDLGYRVRRAARWFTIFFSPIAPLFWLSVIKEAKKLDPDEIRIHMPNTSAFWLFLISSIRDKRWVIVWHSDVLTGEQSLRLKFIYHFYRRLENRLLARADRILATSPPYLEHSVPLSKFYDKCVVEPLVLDGEKIPYWAKEANQPRKTAGEGLRVLSVGRLTYYKGFDLAIKAIKRVPNAQLRIVGNGELRESLEKLISEQEVNDRVTLLGGVSDEELWRQYSWCDLNLVASTQRTEAYGLVINEASMFKRLNLVADLPGSGMAWNAEQTGADFLTFKAGCIDSLVETLSEISKKAENT